MSLVKRDEYTLQGKGKLLLTKDLIDQIDYLHDQVGRIEWCGILFYRHLEGDISKPSSLVLQAEQLYPMDIGSEAYTEADIDMEAIIEMDEVIPDVRNLKKGLIHTHHTMSAFFSGTDMSELHDSTPFHNYYLSLIVNFKGEYVARVAYIAKKKTTVEYKNVKDELQVSSSESEVLAMIDMEIEWEVPEVSVPDFFRARHEKLKQEKAKKVQSYRTTYTPGLITYPSGPTQGAGTPPGRPQWNWDHDQPALTHPKQTTIPFVTKEGNLQVGDKQLRPKSEVSKDVSEKIRLWLSNGMSDFTKGSTSESSIRGILEFFKEYFDFADNEADYPFFVNQMQRSMEDVFVSINPTVVSNIGTDLLDGYDGNDVATDLFGMLDAFPQYMATMNDLRVQAIPKDEVVTPDRLVNKFDEIYQRHLKAGVGSGKATERARIEMIDEAVEKRRKDKKNNKQKARR